MIDKINNTSHHSAARHRANGSTIESSKLSQSSIVSFLFPLAYVIPSSITKGSMNFVGLAIFIGGIFASVVLAKEAFRRNAVLVVSDVAVFSMSLWMLISLYSHEGVVGLYGGGAFAALQFLFVYLLCRAFFNSPASFLIFAERLFYVVIFTVLYAISDTVASENVVLRAGLAISQGGAQQPLATEAYRFGLVRAQGSLEHPILMGAFFVVSAILMSQSLLNSTKKTLALGICAVGVVLALSSAPILSALQAVAIISFYRLFSRFPWAKLVLWLSLFYAIVCVAAFFDQPIATLIKAFTLDPQTGFYRMDIWRWVALNVSGSPWIGIGFADWVRAPNMSATIDSVWLVQSIRYGLPASLLLLLCCATTGITVFRGSRGEFVDPMAARMSLALGTVIFILVFSGLSVHFWGSIWYYFAAALGMRAGLTEAMVLQRSKTGLARLARRPVWRRRRLETM